MIVTIVAVLVALWLFLELAAHVTGNFVHLLLIIAAAVFLYDFFSRRRTRL